MDLNSYIQLKEAYTQVRKPQQLTESVDSIWEEVEAFAHALVEEEGIDLSDMTWDEVREAYMDESRVFGQISRAGAKMFGNAKQKNDAVSYEKSYNDINKRRGQGVGDKKTVTKGEIDAETAGRRKADPKYKPGQGVGSGQKLAANKPAPKPDPDKGGGGGGNNPPAPSPTTQKVAPKPAAPAKDNMAGASKSDRMGAWAKANPKLAAAKKQRDTTKGTSATSNPMMKDLAKRMPKPAAPNKPSGGGLSAVKPQSFKSSVAAGSAMKSASKPAAPKPAASKPSASLTGNKASSFMNKSASNSLSKPMKEESDFDIILAHLIEQGFGDDEALTLMVNMTEEKREEILMMSEGEDQEVEYFNRYGGHPEVKPKKKKKTPFEKENPGHSEDKPTARFTKADREEMLAAKKESSDKVSAAWAKQNPKLAAKKKKTQKEEDESLFQAYLSMMSEEESDKRKDKHLESGGHSAKTDYSKPPATGNDFGKKKPMSDEARKEAMAKVVAKLKKQGGK